MTDLCKNSISFLQKRFPVAPVVNDEAIIRDSNTSKVITTYWPMVALDMHSGIKQRAIAIYNLGEIDALNTIAAGIEQVFNRIENDLFVEMGNELNPTGHKINTTQMAVAPRTILYTNKLCAPIKEVIEIFNQHNLLIDVIDESKIYKTLFISYGGDDETEVAKLNILIKSNGIRTWFFPDDAEPGEKLHRVMHTGVNNHDRVLLVCSKSSLSRSGVLNELERVLEREAKEGGTEILLPIALDDYVFNDWYPERNDIAEQVRSRVITRINNIDEKDVEFQKQLTKIINVLKK